MSEDIHQIDLPEELVPGVYADFASVWHTPSTFTLDFAAVAAPPEMQQDETGFDHSVLKSRVVARVRIPPSQVFEIMKALELQLSAWEREQAEQREIED